MYLGCSIPQQGERSVTVGGKDDSVKLLALAITPLDQRGLLGGCRSYPDDWTA